MILREAFATSLLVSMAPLLRGEIMLQLERVPVVWKRRRVGKAKRAHQRPQRGGHGAQERAFAHPTSDSNRPERALVTSAFRIGVVIAAASIGAATGHAQVETNDPGIVSGTLARIKTTGTVRLGYRDASIPFSYLDRSGRPIGYSIDICNAIVEEIGRLLDREDLKVDFVKVTSETRLQAIVNDTIDLECCSTTNNLERRKLVDFSPMIFVSGTKIMAPVGTVRRDFRDLKGRKVVVTQGTTNAQALKALDQKFKLGITLLEMPSHEDTYRLLADRDADAFPTADILLHALIAQHPSQSRFKVVREFLPSSPSAIPSRPNQPPLHE